MTILVTGTNGQLATAMAQEGAPAIHRLGRPTLDFDHPGTLEPTLATLTQTGPTPRFIVNAAASTAVDAAHGRFP